MSTPDITIITAQSALDPDCFLEENILDFRCSICTLIPNPKDVVEVTCCGHAFCFDCLKKWYHENDSCPLCKKDINLPSVSKVIGNFMKNFKLKCPYNCSFKGKWIELDSHLKECKNILHKCKYTESLGCNFTGTEEELRKHENDVKSHLDIAKNHCSESNNNIMFDLNEEYRVNCHPHPLIFKKSYSWNCDGRKMSEGCYGPTTRYSFPFRFRCSNCDYDLCFYCMQKYAIKKNKF